jgi:MraZ protein
MFRGEHYNSLDGKGRTSIPARLRNVFAETFVDERFVITKCMPVNTDNGEICRGLAIYPLPEFHALEQKFEKGTGLSVSALNGIRRHIFAPAVECSSDKQGRVLIPPTLRDYAGLEKDIIFVGMQRKIEVWDTKVWERVCVQAEKDIPADNATLAELGI